MKVCAQAGCPTLTQGATYCDAHHKARRKASDRRRPSAAKRGYGSGWQRTRTIFLRTHPLCTECGAKATDVHHLDGLGPNGPCGHDEANLQSLCHTHHSAITVALQPGGWAA